jgi:hypothetical protein
MNRKAVLVIVALALLIGIVAVVIAQDNLKLPPWSKNSEGIQEAMATLAPKDPPWDKNDEGLQEAMKAACANGGESCPEG